MTAAVTRVRARKEKQVVIYNCDDIKKNDYLCGNDIAKSKSFIGLIGVFGRRCLSCFLIQITHFLTC